jgi:hypothetical protein
MAPPKGQAQAGRGAQILGRAQAYGCGADVQGAGSERNLQHV